MPYSRKIIRNAYVLSCDEKSPGGIGTVTVQDGRIASVSYGASREDVPAPDVEVIDARGKVLLPGFVDPHVHGESLIFDLVTGGEPIGRWSNISAYEAARTFWYRHATIDDWRTLYTVVCYRALRSGVTFLGEYGIPGGDGACLAALDAFGRTELPGMLTVHNADQLERVRQSRNRSLRFSVSMPPAEELTTYNLQASLRMSREAGYPMLVHMRDDGKDIDPLVKNFGKGPLDVFEEFGLLREGCLIAHLQVREQKDIQRIADGALVPLCSPGGAVRKGLPYPTVHEYNARGIGWALCTDWGTFSHWSVLKSMIDRETMLNNDRPSAYSLLQNLTIHPATAMGMSRDMGSIDIGKRADLQMIQCRNLELQAALDSVPPQQLAEAMIQRVSTSDVSDVMVRGEFLIREGTVLTYSEEDIVRDIRELLEKPNLVSTQKQMSEKEAHEDRVSAIPDHIDEGFRIVRNSDQEQQSANILRLDPERERKEELPKTARRVFGDDDL